MLLMLLIGWIVLLPAIVVAGLYVGSTVLGRRRAMLHAYEDQFADEQSLETEFAAVTAEAIAGPVGRQASPDTPASGASPVSAGY